MMKAKFLFLMIATLGFLSTCNNDDEQQNLTSIEGVWSLVNVSGGFAGVNCNYPAGDILYTFDDNLLTIDNNYTGDTTQVCDRGPADHSGPYSLLDQNGEQYLLLDDQESGGITLSDDELIIDTNETSAGSGADGFVYRLER